MAVSNSCTHVSNTPYPTQTTTLSTGNCGGPDVLAMCSISCLPADSNDHPLGSCQLKVNQTCSVNGDAVQTKQVHMAVLIRQFAVNGQEPELRSRGGRH